MTRKHFEAIAEALRAVKPKSPSISNYIDDSAERVWEQSVEAVCTAIMGFNPRFDEHRFLVACGYDS